MTYVRAEQQPISTEIKMLDGCFVKSMGIHKAGTAVPQHSHAYAHMSVLVRGSVRVTAAGRPDKVFHAPDAVKIDAGIKHLFTSLEDDTMVLCVHDIGTAEGVDVLDEHHLGVGDV